MDTIRFEGLDFTVNVPATWTRAPGDEEIQFVSPDGTHQLIFSVLVPKKALGAGERRAMVEQLAEMRRNALAQLSGGIGQLLPVGGAENDDSCFTALAGADVANGALMYMRIVGTPARVVTASVYRYGTVQDTAAFTEVAENLCGSLEVSHAAPVKTGWRRWLPF
jgi:hypothetical protein